MITAERKNHTITRNCSFFRKLEGKETLTRLPAIKLREEELDPILIVEPISPLSSPRSTTISDGLDGVLDDVEVQFVLSEMFSSANVIPIQSPLHEPIKVPVDAEEIADIDKPLVEKRLKREPARYNDQDENNRQEQLKSSLRK